MRTFIAETPTKSPSRSAPSCATRVCVLTERRAPLQHHYCQRTRHARSNTSRSTRGSRPTAACPALPTISSPPTLTLPPSSKSLTVRNLGSQAAVERCLPCIRHRHWSAMSSTTGADEGKFTEPLCPSDHRGFSASHFQGKKLWMGLEACPELAEGVRPNRFPVP
jgi:hypothetical protein